MSTTEVTQDRQQLRAEIAHTRAELGETVQALAARADVKARAKRSAEDAAVRVRQRLTTARADVGRTADRLTAPVRQKAAEAGRNPAVRRSVRPVVFALVAVTVAAAVAVVVHRRR